MKISRRQGVIWINGGGIFGRIIGEHLRDKGEEVRIADMNFNYSGYKAAGCLIKPSWITKIPDYQKCLDLLEDLFGFNTIEFEVGAAGITAKKEKVWALNKWVLARVKVEYGSFWEPSIYCIGGWDSRGLQKPRLGIAHYGGGSTVARIEPWRPYHQLVRFNISPQEVWASDGIAKQRLDTEDISKSLGRVSRFVEGIHTIPVFGMRPYSQTSDPCLITKVNEAIHVSGGGKNGCIAAAWAALKLTGDL